MRRQRKCRKCREFFFPDPRSYHPSTENHAIRVSLQHYCSKAECQRTSHSESNLAYWMSDAELRQRNSLACRSWRKKHKGYSRKYREAHPEYVKRNRELQRRRDAKSRVHLANTDSIHSLRLKKLNRIRILINLANTDSIKVPWMLISEEIRLYLTWHEHLANTNSMAVNVIDKQQSPA